MRDYDFAGFDYRVVSCHTFTAILFCVHMTCPDWEKLTCELHRPRKRTLVDSLGWFDMLMNRLKLYILFAGNRIEKCHFFYLVTLPVASLCMCMLMFGLFTTYYWSLAWSYALKFSLGFACLPYQFLAITPKAVSMMPKAKPCVIVLICGCPRWLSISFLWKIINFKCKCAAIKFIDVINFRKKIKKKH